MKKLMLLCADKTKERTIEGLYDRFDSAAFDELAKLRARGYKADLVEVKIVEAPAEDEG